MQNSKLSSVNFALRGGIFLLGSILFLFFVYPPLLLLRESSGSFVSTLKSPETLGSLWTSLKIAFGVVILTSVVGGFLAWLNVKTDFPLRKSLGTFSFITFCIPPYILSLSWMQIFGRNGYLERIVYFFNPESNFHSNPYSAEAVIIIMAIHLYPLVYLSLKNSLERVSPELEKAASLAGAGRFQVFRSITLPMILPGLFSTAVLVFSRTIANFSVPALLCLPVGINTLPTGIYSSLSSLKIGNAANISLILVILSTGLHVTQGILLNKERMTPSSGRKASVLRLGKKTTPFCIIVSLFFLISCIIPLISMLLSSFLLRWGLPVTWEYLTLNNYRELLFGEGNAFRAFRNSLVFGGTAAIFAAIISSGTLLLSEFRPGKGSRFMETIATWPAAIPNTVLAIAAIFAWNRPPLKFYGTAWGIIFTYMVLFTPLIMKQVSGLLALHNKDLIKAARISGASGINVFFRIIFPLLVPGYKAGILICLIIALREIPISLMLYASGQETVGVLLFGMQSQSYGLEMTSALAVVLICLIISGNLLQKKWNKK